MIGLHVVGNHLAYGDRTVTLRGVCVGDVILAREGRTTRDYATIAKGWKANCVRIGVAPVSWRREPARALAALRKDVAAALAQGMFVIVDWHAIGWPDGYTQPSDGSTALYDSSLKLATSFWRSVAKTYRNEGRVAFQLWCEPLYRKRDWETRAGATWPLAKVQWRRLTDAIRAQGAPNLVLASGNRWAYDLVGIREDPLPDPNTAYEWHVYAGADDNDPKRWAQALDGLDRVRPVVVTEWGFQERTTENFRGTARSFGVPFLRFMDARRLGWTAWCWHPEWTPVMLKADWKTPTTFGAFVKAALARPREP